MQKQKWMSEMRKQFMILQLTAIRIVFATEMESTTSPAAVYGSHVLVLQCVY